MSSWNHRCQTIEELFGPVFASLEHHVPFEVERDAYVTKRAARRTSPVVWSYLELTYPPSMTSAVTRITTVAAATAHRTSLDDPILGPINQVHLATS